MAKETTFPADIFCSLKDLLGMERYAHHFNLLDRKQKVKSILGGKHASKLRGRGLDFEEVRQYVKGDDIRNIDWKVTARTKETHTRVFSEEKEKPALILVDQSQSMFFGSQKKTKSVVAAELAALAAFKILKEGDRVGGIVFADQGIDIVFPKRDRRNILRFFENIVKRNHELVNSKPGSFDDLLKEVTAKTQNIVTHDFMIIIISDFHRYSANVLKSISILSQHNDVVLAKVSDPFERDIAAVKFVAGDEQTQVAVDGKEQSLRLKFEEGFDADFRNFQVKLKKHRIPIFQVDTVQPIEDQIKDLFKKPTK
ncbi:DUF58 domain-containing protein [Algoriphagus aestuariicola]|uniref:DUF58 domain-containing protein n=1 Tax=Algoriphagus aestuariicola TaxID=1852016 RepID=A0ABS3BR87_9BACT|nr:DUF58 domain-containing protein [Algoriphagus aestuariicola]MBN7801793.1 DUF58 domain-containing protein [Algoriphagus aestuariicola]